MRFCVIIVLAITAVSASDDACASDDARACAMDEGGDWVYGVILRSLFDDAYDDLGMEMACLAIEKVQDDDARGFFDGLSGDTDCTRLTSTLFDDVACQDAALHMFGAMIDDDENDDGVQRALECGLLDGLARAMQRHRALDAEEDEGEAVGTMLRMLESVAGASVEALLEESSVLGAAFRLGAAVLARRGGGPAEVRVYRHLDRLLGALLGETDGAALAITGRWIQRRETARHVSACAATVYCASQDLFRAFLSSCFSYSLHACQ